MRHIKFVVIHCTACQPSAKVSAILNYWRNTLGWRNPGYHRLISVDGETHGLLDFERISNGVRGHNHESIHISYIGGVDRDGLPMDTRTAAQRESIIACIQEVLHWTSLHQTDIPQILGHRDLNPNKACPSFNAKRELSWVTV